MSQDYKYRAFISYSHKDKQFAKWLHKKIENYKIPKSLREKYPNLPKDLKRSVFRDEEELPTGSILSDNLVYALDNSELLIVICSPSSVSSQWVDKEIAYFKHKHGENSVLAIIKDGEPNDTYNDNPNNEAFPKSLRYEVNGDGELSDKRTEPIAGDARSYWDKDMALVKMVAGILKVDFADLWEREKREKRKRKIIAATILSIFIALSFYASTQFVGDKINIELEKVKNDIAKIEYSIRHDNLPVEKVIALNKELEKLKEQKEAKEDTQKSLGQLKTSLGKKAQAVYKQDGAKAAIDILTSRDALSRKEQLKKELSLEEISLAKLYVEENQFDKAEKSYEDAIALFYDYDNVIEFTDFLRIQKQPQKAIDLLVKLKNIQLAPIEKANSLKRHAILLQELNQPKQAISMYEKALLIYREKSKIILETYNINLANTLGRLGELYAKSGDTNKAKKLLDEALLIHKKINETDTKKYKEGIVGIYNALFIAYYWDNNEKGKKFLLQAIEVQKSKQKDPRDKYLLANLLSNLALIMNNTQEKLNKQNEILLIYRRLTKNNPAAYRIDLYKILSLIADTYMGINDIKNAEIYYKEALTIIKKLYYINSDLYALKYIESLQKIGNFYKKNNHFKKAKEINQEILKIKNLLKN